MPHAVAFAEQLVRDKVYVLPGQSCELPGFLRLSLTATEAMMTLRVGAKRHHPRAAVFAQARHRAAVEGSVAP